VGIGAAATGGASRGCFGPPDDASRTRSHGSSGLRPARVDALLENGGELTASRPRSTPTSRSPRSSTASSSPAARAPVREPERREAPAPDQPVRHREAMCLAFGVEKLDDLADRLGEISSCSHRRASSTRCARSEAEVDRRLDAEGGVEGRLPGARPDGRRRRPRPVPDPALAGPSTPPRSSPARG